MELENENTSNLERSRLKAVGEDQLSFHVGKLPTVEDIPVWLTF